MAMMISKFNKLIQSKFVWTAFAALISIAFVGLYTGSRGSGAKTRNQSEKEIVGKLFNKEVTRKEFGNAYQSVYVMYAMNSLLSGRPVNLTDDVDKFIRDTAWQRLAILKKANDMKLTVPKEQIIEMIKNIPLFLNQSSQYDPKMYTAFTSNFLPRTGMTSKGFEEMIRENVLIEKASSVAAQGALVTEDEIKKAFHLYSDKRIVEYATIPRNLVGEVEVTEEEAKAHFEANASKFRYPAKRVVKYVAFDASSYTNDVEVTEQSITDYYTLNQQRYAKPLPLSADKNTPQEFIPLEDVRDEVTIATIHKIARQKAYAAADEMVGKLSDTSNKFNAVAEEAGKTVIENTPAFAATDMVEGIDPYAPFARAAFQLQNSPSHYYSDPVAGRESIYVIALVEEQASWAPSFDLVKDDVIESAKVEATEKAYVEKSDSIHAEIETALNDGKTFADSTAKFKLELQTTALFDLSTTLEGPYGRELKQATVQFDAGTLVNLIKTQDGFAIAYVASKELADEETALPSMREDLSNDIRNEKAGRLAQAWRDAALVEAQLEDFSAKKTSSDS